MPLASGSRSIAPAACSRAALAPALGQVRRRRCVRDSARSARRQRRHTRAPALALGTAATAGVAPRGQHVGRHLERRRRPAQLLARRCGVFGEQPGAVAAALALQPRDALAMTVRHATQRRPRVGLGGADRRRHGFEVVPVDFDDVPTGDAEARGDVFADRQIGGAVVGDAVVVPQQGQLAQAQVPGQRDHLLADALLQAAVADERVGAVVDHAGAEARVRGRPRPPPCRRRSRCPGPAARSSPRCPRRGRIPGGLRSASRSRGRC